MNFKKRYIEWLEQELSGYLPSGYDLKVIDESTQSPQIKPLKTEIRVYVRFGSGSKQVNTQDRINQTLTITALSESDNFDKTYQVLYNLFTEYSKKITILENVEVLENDVYVASDYNVWHNYQTPMIMNPYQQIGTESRTSLIMTGVLSYSKGTIIGSLHYIDDEIVDIIDPSGTYQMQQVAFNPINTPAAISFNESAIITFSGRFLLTNSNVSRKFLDMNYYHMVMFEDGVTPYVWKPIYKVVYNPLTSSPIEYTLLCNIANIQIEKDSANNDNIVSFVLTAIDIEN